MAIKYELHPGKPAPVCQSQGNDFICPTHGTSSTNSFCDEARCPLQGPSMSPLLEPQSSGEPFDQYHIISKYWFWAILGVESKENSGQVVVGGVVGDFLSHMELFPPPPSTTCFIPDLPQPRSGHSISLLSGGRLVVYGGAGFDSCIAWVAGNDGWTDLFTMRWIHLITISFNLTKDSHSQERSSHTAWTPISHPDSIVLLGSQQQTAETVSGMKKKDMLESYTILHLGINLLMLMTLQTLLTTTTTTLGGVRSNWSNWCHHEVKVTPGKVSFSLPLATHFSEWGGVSLPWELCWSFFYIRSFIHFLCKF